MQNGFFMYTGNSLGVSYFTGTGTEFNNVAAGLAKVWDMVAKELAVGTQEIVSLMYWSAEGKLVANLTSNISYTIYGARFHGEISSYDTGLELLERIRPDII